MQGIPEPGWSWPMVDQKDPSEETPPVFVEFSQPQPQRQPRRDAVYQSGPAGPPFPPPGIPPVNSQVELAARSTIMTAGTANFAVTSNDADLTVTRSQRLVVGKIVIANKAAIYFQAVQLELQLQDQIDRAIEERSNSVSVEKLEAICVSVRNLRNGLSAETSPDEAEIGARALSIKDGVLDWWANDHVKILDAAYNTVLFAGCLGLIYTFGTVPAVVAGSIVRGKQVGDALKTGVDFLKSLARDG
jgi:hypothetical protein